MSQPTGIDEARQIIKDIVKEHGLVQESTLELIGSVSKEARREVEEALLEKDKKIGFSVLV